MYVLTEYIVTHNVLPMFYVLPMNENHNDIISYNASKRTRPGTICAYDI